MDPIHPIAPGPPTISPANRPAVERLERITREGDRPSKDTQERRRREPSRAPESAPEPGEEDGPDDGGRPHIDVRV
jgi:hypothetical protein